MQDNLSAVRQALDASATDYLHSTGERVYCEPLSRASAEYDWSIEPHRHEHMLQMFFLQNGRGMADLDGEQVALSSGDLLLIPPNCIHAFAWQKDSAGYVVFINRMLLGEMQKTLGRQLDWCRGGASVIQLGQHEQDINYLMLALEKEQGNLSRSADPVRFHLCAVLLLTVDRLAVNIQLETHKRDRKQLRLEQFAELIDHHFKQHHQVQWYASQLGLTPAHLNSLCRELRGTTAKAFIHQRLVTEAKRQLLYTPASVAEIAIDLGFNDPAYFNRFFKRLEDMPPNRYRQSGIRA